MNLSEFLLARIAEDGLAAQAAVTEVGSSWFSAADAVMADEAGDPPNTVICETPEGSAAHIARWDPARVLAECEAKRRIVALYRGRTGANYSQRRGEHLVAKAALEALALPYADHPDYDEAWRP